MNTENSIVRNIFEHMTIEAMKLALEALELARSTHDVMLPSDPPQNAWKYHNVDWKLLRAVNQLRQAIAEAEKLEPVAWMTINEYGEEDDIHYENPEGKLLDGWTYKPLYTCPQEMQTEPIEYWNAVEGWVKIDEVREHFESVSCGTIYKHEGEGRVPLYTSPPQRQWVGLTHFDRTHLRTTHAPLKPIYHDKDNSICAAVDFFNFRPMPVIVRYLEATTKKLRPGGTMCMTINDCDHVPAVLLTEKGFACYTPGSAVIDAAEDVGLELSYQYHCEGEPVTWLEFRRPGRLTTVRGGQTLAKIIPKQLARSQQIL